MTQKEVRELLLLKEWTRQDLANRLGVCKSLIEKWLVQPGLGCQRTITEKHAKKMRKWLTDARQECRSLA